MIKNIEDKIPGITNLATNTTLNAKISEAKEEIPNIDNLATTAAIKAKINEVKNKIPNITNFSTTTALTAVVENKIPNVSNLVKKKQKKQKKKQDYHTKISETENKITTNLDQDKYITIQELNKLTSQRLTARLKEENLTTKNDIANFVKRTDFDKKLENVK